MFAWPLNELNIIRNRIIILSPIILYRSPLVLMPVFIHLLLVIELRSSQVTPDCVDNEEQEGEDQQS